MAAKGTIGGKIVLEGESQYRAALKNIKSDQAELRSEMKLCQSTFKENQNSLEALEKKYEIMTKQVDTQVKKLEVYHSALETSSKKESEAAKRVEELQTALINAEKVMKEMADSSDISSEAVEDQAKAIDELKQKLILAEQNYDKAAQKTSSYQTAVNNAQAELQGMQSELKKTEQYIKEAEKSTDQCATSIDQFGKETKEAGNEAIGFGDVLKANITSDVIMAGLSRLKDLAKEVGEALIDCAIGAAQYADDIATTATNTGIATGTLQELTYAQELMDVSLETVTSSMAKNIKAMDSARKGSVNYIDAYEQLGVTIHDTDGKLKNSEDVFWEVIDALGKMENATERDAIAMQLMGKKAQDLNSLITIGSKGFKELGVEARTTGFVLSEDMLNALLDTSDAMEVMKNRVTGVKNRIGAELAPIFTKTFDQIADTLEDAEKEITDFAEDAIPALVTGLEWIIDNANIVAAGIGGITTATLYHSTVVPAIKAITTAWNTYKTANEGATISQWLLNSAINANPAGILVTSIVALTGAVATYLVINRDNLSLSDEVTKKTKEQVEAAKELNNEYLTATADREAARQELEAEAVSCKNLVAELKDLQAKTALTNSEQTRQRMIVEQLNQVMPELNLSIDEQTGKLNMSTSALEKNVEAMMALAKAEAAREDMTRIAEEQYEAEKQLAELQEQLIEQREAVAQAQENYNKAMENSVEAMSGLPDAFGTMAAAETEYLSSAVQGQRELEEQINATQETINGFTAEYEETMAYISDTEALVVATQSTGELGEAAIIAGEQMSGMSDKVAAAYERMSETLNETITNQMNLFDEFNAKSALSTQELLTNMQSQIDGISAWSENLKILAEKGIDQGLLEKLANMGPEGAGYVATFVQMTDEELQKANDLFEQSLVIPNETVETVAEAYVVAGEKAVESFRQGIDKNTETVAEAAGEMANRALDSTRQILDSHSPSNETKKIGEDYNQGFILGVTGSSPEVLNTISNLTAEIVRLSQNGLQTSTFITIGKQIPAGLVQGIESGRSSVINAIVEMCTAAVDAGEKTLDINSPSRKFDYMGEMSGEGYIGGWKRSMANINAVIAEALPDTFANYKKDYGSSTGMVGEQIVHNHYHIPQEINLYGSVNDLITTSREFKEAQKEAAREWS